MADRDPAAGHNHHNGAASCPLCSRHDHQRTEPFGYDTDGQPVPAWWFTCGRCGTADSQIHVHRWTSIGIAWQRDNADVHGTKHERGAA